eukprot:c27053_g4_i1 orf=80-274(+)
MRPLMLLRASLMKQAMEKGPGEEVGGHTGLFLRESYGTIASSSAYNITSHDSCDRAKQPTIQKV